MAKFEYPEKVEQMHMDILDAVKGIDIDRLLKLAEAEREGRVVVLPVKQGTRFYAAIRDHGRIIEQDFDKFELTLMNEKGWGVVAFENGEITPIFSSRAEAERALTDDSAGNGETPA